ncbi:hypothetical protein [Streptomyces sp. VRA16 Mangrove soil]|uniref:hypothetical protein n=1 Tax=Streptomyces sp. VRA16 Mangrove soil TaxID=2817434 RepID=UPI001A9F8B8F|nr:hypothetical protein [Streptomyces sp. VRA16 Mangrove soil]MBO1337248.1 hypothetical protein [Streptomyces sp. VRA16 Mangrove soil]
MTQLTWPRAGMAGLGASLVSGLAATASLAAGASEPATMAAAVGAGFCVGVHVLLQDAKAKPQEAAR